MVFGYTAAVFAGFLLTAVRNWTGRETWRGGRLAFLAVVWLLGRILPFLSGWVPDGTVTAIDLLFLPLLAVSLAGPLLADGKARNLVVVPLLFLWGGGNLLFHLERLGIVAGGSGRGLACALDLIVLMIVIIGGRVIPFFTERAISGALPHRRPWLDRMAQGVLFLLLVVRFFFPEAIVVGVGGALAALLLTVQLSGWHDRRVWSIPLLRVLYLGYGWIVVGLFLSLPVSLGWVERLAALHAITAGGIGGMTLGMMARVSLGHTGRPLQPAPRVSVAFILINGAALARVVPLLLPAANETLRLGGVTVGSILWCLAFLLFALEYTPILLRPRADGKPG
ncbi:MAG: NnrS family protein [Deltaproteobacteria bacterium]|nr:MAG: NnrS family protein [Deltaproteobacteria bacterium]